MNKSIKCTCMSVCKTLYQIFLFVYFISHVSSNTSCNWLAGILYICQVLLGILCHEYLHHIPTFFYYTIIMIKNVKKDNSNSVKINI